MDQRSTRDLNRLDMWEMLAKSLIVALVVLAVVLGFLGCGRAVEIRANDPAEWEAWCDSEGTAEKPAQFLVRHKGKAVQRFLWDGNFPFKCVPREEGSR